MTAWTDSRHSILEDLVMAILAGEGCVYGVSEDPEAHAIPAIVYHPPLPNGTPFLQYAGILGTRFSHRSVMLRIFGSVRDSEKPIESFEELRHWAARFRPDHAILFLPIGESAYFPPIIEAARAITSHRKLREKHASLASQIDEILVMEALA